MTTQQPKKKIVRKATRMRSSGSQSTQSSIYARVPYKIQYAHKVIAYIKTCYRETADMVLESDGREIQKRRCMGVDVSVRLPKRTEWRNVQIPSIQGYARQLSVSRKTLEKWGEEHEEFQDALDRITDAQHEMLIQYGLSGYFNTKIVALLLSKHGYGTQAKEENDSIQSHHFLLMQAHKRADEIIAEHARMKQKSESV
jgi:hypothetical protein